MTDLAYKAATFNDRMPYTAAPSQPRDSSGPLPLLDAVYIPTLANRPPPETSLNLIRTHARTVYLLFSSEAASWVPVSRYPWLHVFCDFPSHFDLKSYSSHPTNQNPSTRLRTDYDLPAKRTFALLHARQHNHRAVAMIDDDIALTSADFMHARIALDAGETLAAFHVLDYPDVSTVDHIERILTRQPSRVSLGGNCLFLATQTCGVFFPSVYNDDWFFLLSHVPLHRIVSLGTAMQRSHRPWLDDARVAFEQFGDMVIEGVKENIGASRSPFDCVQSEWNDVRDRYYDRLLRLRSMDVHQTFASALHTALQTASQYSGADLTAFVAELVANPWVGQ